MNFTTLEAYIRYELHAYRERVPTLTRVLAALHEERVIEREEEFPLDSIAFRTFGLPHLGIERMERIFLSFEYQRCDSWDFPDRHIGAYWYMPPITPAQPLPRFFVSELRVNELPEETRDTIAAYMSNVADERDARPPTFADYQRVSQVSEYGGWLLANRRPVIHAGYGIHDLPVMNTIEAFNALLERHAIPLLENNGNAIRRSEDGLLVASSTLPDTFEAEFADGTHQAVPGPYIGFIERRVDEEGYLREGFT
jgi:hypothetical protein